MGRICPECSKFGSHAEEVLLPTLGRGIIDENPNRRSAMPLPPTREELKKLPLRAIVAYAARCARRVQPLFRLDPCIPRFAEHEAAVERAISVAERFCLGRDMDTFAAAAADAVYGAAGR